MADTPKATLTQLPGPTREIEARESYARDPLDWEKISESGQPPARDWVIKNWLGMGHVTYLAGSGGLGKSIIAQQLATAVSLGIDFISNVIKPRVTLAWMGEDDQRELTERQYAICKHFERPIDSLRSRFFLESMSRTECSLFDYAAGMLVRTSMLRELRAQIGDYKAEVVILDNASCVYGANENDRHHVKSFFAALAWAAEPTNAAVLMLGHTSKAQDSEYSGSTAWENSCRARLWFSDHPPDRKVEPDSEPLTDLRYLSKRKANYSARDLCILRYDDGAYTIVQAPDDAGGLVGNIRANRARQVVMQSIALLKKMGLDPTEGRSSPSFLPKLCIMHGLAEGCTSGELDRAMRMLMTDGIIARRQVGTYNNRVPKYGIVLVG